MHDNDFIDMSNAWHLSQELMPSGFTLEFVADRSDTTAKSLIELKDLTGGYSRKVEAGLVHELRTEIVRFIGEALKARGDFPFMTATGVDEQTDIERLARWGLEDLELGFLYSDRWAGEAKRYPSWEWIEANAAKYPRCALHICGNQARRELRLEALNVSSFQRIQINGDVRPGTAGAICAKYPDHTIILQYQGPNSRWMLGHDWNNLTVLIDASGGNGILPKFWPRVETKLRVGFAGGLNPHNMEEEVRKIRTIADPGWWVDLESGLRDEEWFSIELLESVHRSFRRGLTRAPVCQACGDATRMLEHEPGVWVCHGTHVRSEMIDALPHAIVR